MEEQKNLKDSSASRVAKTVIQKNIPTVAGVMIILIIAVLAGSGIFYFLQTSFLGEDYTNPIRLKTSILKEKTQDSFLKDPILIKKEKVTEPAVEKTFDFDSELKKLDEQNNAIISDDFNENEMSDANIGL